MRFKKLLAIAAATTSIGAVAAPASAAEAAPPAQSAAVAAASCGTISFTYHVEDQKNWLDVNCGSVIRGAAWVIALSGDRFKLRVVDTECDSFGFSLQLHGHVLPTNGCGTANEKIVTRSSIGSPQNWWVFANGTTNSKAYPLPVY